MPDTCRAPDSKEKLHCRINDQLFLIGTVGAGDKAQLERLFAQAFGAPPGAGWYQWKYGTLGGIALGLWNENGELVAHYAGFPRTLLWRGRPLPTIQIGDVMVIPELRGLLTRRGPFFQVCSRFFAARVGAEREFMLAFGFPNERAIRLGVKLDLYHDAGLIHQMVWPARPTRLPFGWAWSSLGSDRASGAAIARAWRAMAGDFSDHVLGVRDADYVARRFALRPDSTYRLFRLYRRLIGSVAAVAVLRLAPGQAELLDMIGSRDAFPLLVRAALSEAAKMGSDYLSAWASPAAAKILQGTGASIATPAAYLAVAKASALRGDDILTAPWWWMGGDTDFR